MGELTRTLLLIVACAPILYWLGKIITAFFIYKFASPHFVTMQYEDKSGKVLGREIVDVSKDKSFYAAVSQAYKHSQHKEGNA